MKEDINKTTILDATHSLVKGGLGAIPLFGSLASEIFALIVTPPLEKRRAEWMSEIATRLKKLENEDFIDISQLSQNEQFVDIILQSTTLALKTSEKEKILAFQNAVLNTALGEAPSKTISHIFLNQLDNFTVWHIKILKFINNPREWFKNANIEISNLMSGSISFRIKEAFPDLANQDDLIDIIWKDLERADFHRTGSVKSMMSGEGTLNEQTTNMGKKFLKFITNFKA